MKMGAIGLLSLATPCLLLLSFFMSSAEAREDNEITRAYCLFAYGTARFDVRDYASYDSYFDDKSFMQLAEAGVYVGKDAIEEYVRFVDVDSPFADKVLNLDQSPSVKTASDPDTGDCVLNIIVTDVFRTSAAYSNEEVFTSTGIIQIHFEPQVPFGIYIRRVNVFFEPEFLANFFGNVMNTPQTRGFICQTMESSCPDVWTANGFASQDSCSSAIGALALTDAGNDVTGNSSGCKGLHSVFAATNSIHCGHISLVPYADPNGDVKCQNATGIAASDLFDADDFAALYDRVEELNYDPSGTGFYLCDCAREESAVWYGFFTWVWSLFVSINPFPNFWPAGFVDVPKCVFCS